MIGYLLSSLNFKFGLGVLVCEIDDLELPGVDVEDCADEDILDLK